MGKDPAFLFYPGDYIGGTMGMTFEEKGAYMDLLMMQFNRGHMTTDMIGQTVGQLWDKIQVKFIQDDKGLWYNERLDLEKSKRKSFVSSRKNNLLGSNQYTKKIKKNIGHTDGHMSNHMEDKNKDINKDINISFKDFWDLYDKKVGKLEKIEKKWNKLKDTDRELIMEHIPRYKLSKPDKQYRKNPEVYFNNEAWKDEIIEKTSKLQKKTGVIW